MSALLLDQIGAAWRLLPRAARRVAPLLGSFLLGVLLTLSLVALRRVSGQDPERGDKASLAQAKDLATSRHSAAPGLPGATGDGADDGTADAAVGTPAGASGSSDRATVGIAHAGSAGASGRARDGARLASLSRPAGGDGVASYYADSLAGNTTASGEPYRPQALTAAHRTLPFGTMVRVRRPDTGSEVVVRINDRGPNVPSEPGRVIDLSRRAAETLGIEQIGLAPVELEILPRATGAAPGTHPDVH